MELIVPELYIQTSPSDKQYFFKVLASSYLTFGLPGWAEVMIGFAVGSPL
jgi:hypothetical protein